MSVPSIPEFYNGKTIFITGSTGFLGKVILEKLLRSCPGIKTIYLIIRSQKNKCPEDRLKEITDLPLFDRLRECNSEALKKVVVMEGNVSKLNLGLRQEDYDTLANKVDVIFHVAASVRFDDSISDAVIMNTRGTLQILKLALKIKTLQAFVHVSTTYCNCDRRVVKEIIYPPHAEWQKMLDVVENIDSAIINILTPKILGTLPNTYTFSKSLSEHILNDHKDRIPIVIFRPSIVISSWKDPIPGWLDSFNGPVSLMLGTGKGVIRTCLVDPDIVPDYMPVDIAAKAMIAAAWHKSVNSNKENQISIYNCSSMSKSVSMTDLMVIGFDAFWKSPEPDILWVPTAHFCQNETWFFYNSIFKHFLPALIVDQLLKLTGRKPMLMRLQKKIYRAMISLSYFTLREWTFKNDNFLNLNQLILPEDKSDFDYDFSDINPQLFFDNAMKGGRIYLLKEDNSDSTMLEAKKKSYRLYYIDKFIKIAFTILIFYYLYKAFNLLL